MKVGYQLGSLVHPRMIGMYLEALFPEVEFEKRVRLQMIIQIGLKVERKARKAWL